ncbi:MAG: PEP/pyruvate-binding domain-containing protein, partial [Oscillospiraceae bacterium]
VDICVQGKICGQIIAAYPLATNKQEQCHFLLQEERLMHSLARKIGNVLIQKQHSAIEFAENNWYEIIKLLQSSNHSLLLYVCEKMLSTLAIQYPQKAESILEEFGWSGYNYTGEVNIPLAAIPKNDEVAFSNSVFKFAKFNFSNDFIYENVNRWIYQFKTYEMIKIITNQASDVNDISKSLKSYLGATTSFEPLSTATNRWLLVELIRRFLTDQPSRIENIRQYVDAKSFDELLDSIISTPGTGGKIGGKATGIFLSQQIIKNQLSTHPELENIRFPKTWYIPVEEFSKLINDNNLQELNEHKYQDIAEIRILYPKIIQTIKNLTLSPYMLNNLRHLLDNCSGKPLIVRSSSLLEDQIGSAFSGKYKSLFIPNTKDKQTRLDKLVDSILEVYSSIYNHDAIQYRKERNLLDSPENMGIIIQEVVGNQIGEYYFPLYAGVAFSNNEFRWSPRIRREDGLIRLVVGLGTRAVDRLKDDYPMLISPAQPNLTLNQIPSEMQKYSSKYMDVIDTQNDEFCTLSIEQVVREYGDKIPHINNVVSTISDDIIRDVNMITTNFKTDNFIVTFNGLIKKTAVATQIRTLLLILQDALGFAVDMEFAADEQYIYILQCRPQSKGDINDPPAIPSEIKTKTRIFTANKYISNGKVRGIKTVVYVDPEKYSKLPTHQDMQSVGNAVSALNKMLLRKSFILIGPGRWGSRGDIKLGVPVTYSDICNTAMLIEVASEKDGFRPELSFGTHFFQDLVEAGIYYLPLYPEDKNNIFNRSFFDNSNALSQMLPEYAYLDEVIKVINIPAIYNNNEAIIRMNADLQSAVAYLDTPHTTEKDNPYTAEKKDSEVDMHGWQWRHFMAEQIAKDLDLVAFGIKAIYLFGSTNSCCARLNSDIDLLVHIDATKEQIEIMNQWFNGWSLCLAQINFLQTGYSCDGLLDIHYVTDEDIAAKDSFATIIDSVYEPPLLLKKRD